MGYKTTSASRVQAKSTVSSAVAVFNTPSGTGFGVSSTALAGKEVVQFSVVPGTASNVSTSTATVNISSVQIANSSFFALDDTAVSTAGGYLIVNGTGFQSGATVRVQGTSANAVAFVSSSRLNVTVPAISSGTLDLYVINPDGSGAILLSGFVSSGVPSWTTTSPLTQQDIDSAFSIQLEATGDGTVTYSLTSGSTLPPGTSLASNGRFSGTVTGLEQDTTYTFSVDAIDSQNQETARSFNITVTAGDFYYYLTTLHLSGEASANAWISDASTNNFALTVNGDTRPVAFSPYETVWSNYFDGTDDYLRIPANSAFVFGTNDFTIETWVYRTASNNGFQAIITNWTTGWWFGFSQDTFMMLKSGGVGLISDTATSPLNSWNHYCVSRSGSTVRLFVNGVLKNTVTDTNDFSGNNNIYIGITDGTNHAFPGYISNLRVVKGTALYTSNFTPSTSPLTAIANTSLLTCQSNRLVDNSANAFTITRTGGVSVSNFGPFVETDTTTGSGYFDGTGDYLSVADSATLELGSSDFCIEGWYYPTTFASNLALVSKRANTTATGAFVIYANSGSGSLSFYASTNGSTYFWSGSTVGTLVLNQWNHFAVYRIGNNWYGAVNGTVSSMGSNSSSIHNNTDAWTIGGDTNGNYANGYISNVRFVIGNAVYTSANFTPPTSPLTAIANTSLLTLQNRFGENNNRIVDTSGINSIVTRNGNATQGAFSPFSQTGWSNYFDGTGDYLDISNVPTNFGSSSNFTIEFWMYPTVIDSTIKAIFDPRTSDASAHPLIWINASNRLYYFTTNAARITGTTTLTANKWYHVALVRNSGTTTLYLDGVVEGTPWSDTVDYLTSTTFRIGQRYASTAYNYGGYLSNLRIVNGTAVYTSSFTPPTSPLTAIANTSLLTCQSNRFIDSSNNNFTITRNGDTSVQAFSPFKPTSGWSLSTVGGSMYFDGTGDYLTVPDNAALESFADFTIEFWVYFNSVSGSQVVVDKGWNGSTFSPYLIFLSSGSLVAYASSGSSWDVLAGSSFGTLTTGQWYHIALTRSGSSIRLFRNGTIIVNATNSTALMNSASALGIGASPSAGANPLNGYISNLRIIKGAAAYTANFTPPTAPAAPIANTTLLLSGSNGGIIDYTSRNNLETVGNVQLSTSIKKYGNTSMYFDGTGDWLIIPNSQNFVFGSGNWTIELWVRPSSTSRQGFVTLENADGTNVPWELGINNGGKFRALVQTSAGQVVIDGTTTPSVNTWYHVAAVRNGSTVTLYVNGVSEATGSVSTNSLNSETSPVYVGTYNYGFPLTGYIDDLRITKGYARYTANFTPPTSAFKTK